MSLTTKDRDMYTSFRGNSDFQRRQGCALVGVEASCVEPSYVNQFPSVHEFFPVKRAACGMGHTSKLDRCRGKKLGKVTWSQHAGISSNKQTVSGIKKTGTDTIKNKQVVDKMSNCGLETSQGIDERHQHRPSHVKSGELALGSIFGFLIAGPHY